MEEVEGFWSHRGHPSSRRYPARGKVKFVRPREYHTKEAESAKIKFGERWKIQLARTTVGLYLNTGTMPDSVESDSIEENKI
jgi:hypothetical protein